MLNLFDRLLKKGMKFVIMLFFISYLKTCNKEVLCCAVIKFIKPFQYGQHGGWHLCSSMRLRLEESEFEASVGCETRLSQMAANYKLNLSTVG